MKTKLVDIKPLSNIAPKWNAKIESGNLNASGSGDEELDLGQNKKCIVGEAWGFSTDYNHKCVTCVQYGMTMSLVSLLGPSWREDEINYQLPREMTDMFMRVVKSFVKHWNIEHDKPAT